MQLDFEELDYQQTPLGDISLRRKNRGVIRDLGGYQSK
jgi:hypothetical protein